MFICTAEDLLCESSLMGYSYLLGYTIQWATLLGNADKKRMRRCFLKCCEKHYSGFRFCIVFLSLSLVVLPRLKHPVFYRCFVVKETDSYVFFRHYTLPHTHTHTHTHTNTHIYTHTHIYIYIGNGYNDASSNTGKYYFISHWGNTFGKAWILIFSFQQWVNNKVFLAALT